ncbi:MAG: heme-binding protein [Desulfovibrionaceae bacterium]|nr:heme-binding protein [Desulfovibrionaceae bacterium]
MRRLFSALLLALVLALPAHAAVDASKLQLPGDLTQAQAEVVLKGALAKAVEQGVPMNIAVVDAGSNLKAFIRMDGAFLGSIDVSIGKAETARLFNMSTADLGAASQPGGELFGIQVTNGRLVIFGGGELLRDAAGCIIGAIGVSGGSVAEDTNVARAGVAALEQSHKGK